jgi:hypothetical protein
MIQSAAILLEDPSALGLAEPLVELLGWVPAIVFPAATGLQLLAILRSRSAKGVSILAWSMFAFANASLFVYTEKYGEIESIVGTLGTAGLNLCIVAAALKYRARGDASEGASDGASDGAPDGTG